MRLAVANTRPVWSGQLEGTAALSRPGGSAARRGICGWTLARAHARSGDRIALAAYLGRSARFDQAIADFAEPYADQNERDYTAFQTAAQDGQVPVTTAI